MAEGRFHDWRGLGAADGVEAARAEARRALGVAIDAGPADALALARAELAVQRAIAAALERLGVRGVELDGLDGATRRPVVQLLTAPDTRARYVFLEDLLHAMAGRG